MPQAQANGARIYYEEAGAGVPIVFVHEFAGDYRSWDDQIRHFSRGYRCITMSARGYPKSDCPDDVNLYGQSFFTADVIAVMDAAGVDKAHVVGLSMGGYATLMVGLEHPHRVRSLIPAGAGTGSNKAARAEFVKEYSAAADHFIASGKVDGHAMGISPSRVQLLNKDPVGWRRFADHLSEHPAVGSANTLRKVQSERASLYDFEARLRACQLPTLLMVGDEDEPCLDVNLWMKRIMPTAELAVLPASGHAINLEEPALFNQLVGRFISSVDLGQWRPRDPRAAPVATNSGLQGMLEKKA
jgi:pimeloyl-ACP methyl ester carboxylesterase